MQKQPTNIKDYKVGDLVYYCYFEKPKLAIIVKAKKLLKLYDILIQTDNIYVKDVHVTLLQKAT